MIPEPVFDPRLLRKAAGSGRVRDAALTTWRRCRQSPRRAGPILRGALRRNRSLHSRERRLVQDGLFGLVRNERGLAALLGTEDELALWLGWLVLQGLAPAEAQPELDGPWEAFRDQWAALGEGRPTAERLALRHSLPDELARGLVHALGDMEAERFVVASDARAPLSLRANRLRCSRDALEQRLRSEGIETLPSDLVPDALRVVGRHNLEGLASFRDGWFEVQDEGSQLLAALVEPDGPVLDFCAGAGGKCLAIAAQGVPVTALDVRGASLVELGRRATRAGARIEAHRIAATGALPHALTDTRFRRVLVDAPCSGTGVLRRHPEHRYLVDEGALLRHAQLQAAILERAAPLVDDGGRLVYGTCSVLLEENDAVVQGFLGRHPDWEVVGEALRVAPHTHGTDGFFGVVLERTAG